MIRSMTGFGQASRSADGYTIQVDLKSVNHRYNEIVLRMPREWTALEDRSKRIIQSRIKRGRVDGFVTVERITASETTIELNWPVIDGYMQAAEHLKQKYSLERDLTLKDLLLLPDAVMFRETKLEASEQTERLLAECIEDALAHLVQMRETEGKHLYADLTERLRGLERLRADMKRLSVSVVQEYRNKLRSRLQDLLSDQAAIDEHRFTMEIAVLADRSNIDEELTRLESHMNQCKQLLTVEEPVGRKLDFLIQEMNREANTIGSKSNQTELVNRVVDMKAELEKIREQIQNIE